MSVWEIRKCSVCRQPAVSRFVWRNAGWRVRIVGPDVDEIGRSRWASWWGEDWLQCLTSSMPATISFVLLHIFLILLNSKKEVIKWTVWKTSLPALWKKKTNNKHKNIQTKTQDCRVFPYQMNFLTNLIAAMLQLPPHSCAAFALSITQSNQRCTHTHPLKNNIL